MPGGLLPFMLLALVPLPPLGDGGASLSCDLDEATCEWCVEPDPCPGCDAASCPPCPPEDPSCKPCPPEDPSCAPCPPEDPQCPQCPEQDGCCPSAHPSCHGCPPGAVCFNARLEVGYDHWAAAVCAGATVRPDLSSPPTVHAGPYRCQSQA